MLFGKAGRDKSVFLLVFVLRMLLCARPGAATGRRCTSIARKCNAGAFGGNGVAVAHCFSCNVTSPKRKWGPLRDFWRRRRVQGSASKASDRSKSEIASANILDRPV